MGFSLQDFLKLTQNISIGKYSTWLMRNICKYVSSRPSALFGRFWWNDSAWTSFPATTTQLYSQSLSSHTLCSCLENFSTTHNIRSFWDSEFHQVSTRKFCSWDDTFTTKWNGSSPNNLSKCTENAPTLSTSTNREWNLYLSWSIYLVTFFMLKLNFGGFLNIKTKRVIPTDTENGFSPLVSLKSMWTVWRKLLSSGLNCRLLNVWLFMYCPVVFNVCSLELPSKKKTTQQWSLRVANDIVLNPVGEYHENVCGKCRKQILVG